MSLPVFLLDGTPSDTWGIYLPKKTLSLLPPTRDVEVTIPGRPGVLDYRTEFDKREIKLELLALAQNKVELMTNLRAFSKAISPTAGYRAIVFDDDDKEYRVKVTGQSEIEFGQWWAKFELTLKMADPFVYAKDDMTVQSTLAAGDTMTISNPGTAETGMIVMITPVSGTITDPSFVVNAVTFSWTGQITAGITLHVDTGAMTVSLGPQNALAGWSGDWPTLQPGDNILTYGHRAGSGDALVTVIFRPRWI